MDLFKFALGPYEFFASIIGGVPILLATFLLYNPVISLQELIVQISASFSIQLLIALSLCSYLLGGLTQGITWKYFLVLCDLFDKDFEYFGKNFITNKNKELAAMDQQSTPKTLEFEDKLVLLLREKIGIPNPISWIYPRLCSYLKEHNRPSIVTADLYQATHIMYRNISFCLLLVGLSLFVNLLRVRLFSFEQLLILLAAVVLAYVAFVRSVSFKRWYTREVLLGFYFAVCNEDRVT
jgi:hypothetical protein